MEVLRYTRDMYGQETLQGVSWDLLPYFAGAAAIIIVGHLAYSFYANGK
ncbi:MAG: hypothetical protein HOH19_13180 [Kordiimonadaceae bacterium]|nr:hypothetical protein [Kordiimonadaceae bacterium]MBT6033523.1 hypothetical protein [Kordiimonadaceae bacterium]